MQFDSIKYYLSLQNKNKSSVISGSMFLGFHKYKKEKNVFQNKHVCTIIHTKTTSNTALWWTGSKN